MKYLFGLFILASFSCKRANNKKTFPDVLCKMQADFNREDSTGYQNMMLRLYADGNYSHFAANFYNFGTWKWSDTTTLLTLTPKQGNPFTNAQMFLVQKPINGQFRFKKIERKEGNIVFPEKGSSIFNGFRNVSKVDPFLLGNNSWRIKPTSSETTEQVKKRTKGYLEFLQLYYQYTIDNDVQTLTSGWYPAPLQMNYNNGVRMAYNTEVKDWYACFYNDTQAIEAYKMLTLAIRKIHVGDIEDLRERNLDIVKQMIAAL
jgi:hypothetical protein